MYLISAYFDESTNKTLKRYIEGIAEYSGNKFMLDNNVPPHLTILSIEAPSKELLINRFEQISEEIRVDNVIIPSVGQLFPYVIYAIPVMNDYLLNLQEAMTNAFRGIDGVSFSKYYKRNSWLPHLTLGKTLDENQMKEAFRYVQKHFTPIEARIEKIGLAKTNPHEDLAIKILKK